MLKFEHPLYQLLNEEQDYDFFISEVVTGLHRIDSVYAENELSGFIHAFDYDVRTGSCETGIGIFPAENQRRGIGFRAYRLFLPAVFESWRLKSIFALTHPKNSGAIKLFDKLGFKKDTDVEDHGLRFRKFVLKSKDVRP